MEKAQLSQVLTELSNASKSVTNEEQLQSLISKYDIIFAGESFNCILTLDLLHVLKEKFHVKTDLDEINSLVPSVCAELGMKIEPMAGTLDPSNPKIRTYHVYL